jgi:hypothetical protein
MSTSPVSPEDIRAAAEVHQELGPEYSDAVVAAFLDKIDKEVDARVEARLAEASRGKLSRRGRRRTLVAGVAMGACAGALVTGISVAHFDHSSGPAGQGSAVSYQLPGGAAPRFVKLPGGHGTIVLPAAPGK